MYRSFIYLFSCLFSLTFLISCSSSSSLSNTTSTPNINISFSVTTVAPSFEQELSALTVTPSESYCDVAGENASVGSETQSCYATPYNYSLNVLAIYLVECQNSSGDVVVCNSNDVASVSNRVTLYEGDAVGVTMTTESTEFNADLSSLSDDITVGGVQIVTSYIQQALPSTSDSSSEAAKISTQLQGISYRICTAPEDEVDMEENCGNSEAQMGDYLIDMDSDGSFGFMVIDSDSSVSETSTRPSPYTLTDENFPNQNVTFSTTGEDYTDGVFYSVDGYFAPILPLAATQELSSDSLYELSINFGIGNSFMWTDGADGPLADASTCVQAITDASCVTDKDSGSVGVYNPYYDTSFLPQNADPTLSFTEFEDCESSGTCNLRLVFFGPSDSWSGSSTDTNTIYTAVSNDGINFVYETDIFTSNGITDPDAFDDGTGQVVLFTSRGSEIVRSTASTWDGAFTEDSSFSWNNGAVCETQLIGSQYITYYSENLDDGIGYAIYDPATETLTDQGTALANPFSDNRIGDPSVIQIGDASYLMFYKYERDTDSSSNPSGHDIYTATSADGVTWVTDTSTAFAESSSVPGALYANSTIFVYYVNGDTDEIDVAISTDEGQNYTTSTVDIFNLQNSLGVMFDPNPQEYQ